MRVDEALRYVEASLNTLQINNKVRVEEFGVNPSALLGDLIAQEAIEKVLILAKTNYMAMQLFGVEDLKNEIPEV